MAILKHISVKNRNYKQAIDYVLFQHNEQTGEQILDEKGRRLLRDEYYLDGINCDPLLFDKECEETNRAFHKNQGHDEIKMHHYIISFDPKDKEDHDLTGERAQSLGLEFAKRNFPGHQMIVCTHTDGHNKSGNIHAHIILNSVRKYDVEPKHFMERPCDSLAGYKHHVTDRLLKHLQQDLMDMCQREGLHQIDLFQPSAKNISTEEYYAKRHGQKKLDKRNRGIRDFGLEPRKTTFQTQKESLRNAIEDIAGNAKSLEDLTAGLKEKYDIDLIFKRGRFSYHLPDREKNISERSLGSDYGAEFLLQYLYENEKGLPHKKAFRDYHELPSTVMKDNLDPYVILNIKSELRLVINLQTCVKAQLSRAYARKVQISNLKQMAETILYVQEHGYATKEELQDAVSAASLSSGKCKIILEAARSELAHFQDLSSDEREVLLSKIEAARTKYRHAVSIENELQVVDKNVAIILNDEPSQVIYPELS